MLNGFPGNFDCRMGHGPRRKPLDRGAHPNKVANPGIFIPLSGSMIIVVTLMTCRKPISNLNEAKWDKTECHELLQCVLRLKQEDCWTMAEVNTLLSAIQVQSLAAALYFVL